MCHRSTNQMKTMVSEASFLLRTRRETRHQCCVWINLVYCCLINIHYEFCFSSLWAAIQYFYTWSSNGEERRRERHIGQFNNGFCCTICLCMSTFARMTVNIIIIIDIIVIIIVAINIWSMRAIFATRRKPRRQVTPTTHYLWYTNEFIREFSFDWENWEFPSPKKCNKGFSHWPTPARRMHPLIRIMCVCVCIYMILINGCILRVFIL